MKSFIICLVLGVLYTAQAEAQEERAPATPHQQYCMRVGFGAAFRIQGNPGIVKWFAQGFFPEEEENFSPAQRELSRTAIYIKDDGESADEKKGWEEPLLLGWRIEDEYIAQNKKPMLPGDVFKSCLGQKDTYEQHWQIYQGAAMVLAASSEALRQQVCTNKASAADELYKHMKVLGMTKEEIVNQPHDPDMQPGQMHEVAVWMDRIENWKGTWMEFVHTIYKECMGF
jgi:hypothetical protein